MQVERRALNAEEAAALSRHDLDSSFFRELKEYVGTAVFMGTICVFLAMMLDVALTKLIDVDLLGSIHIERIVLLAVWAIGTLAGIVYFAYDIWSNRKLVERRRAGLLTSDDLSVEYHQIEDCKFVREPEHGQPMYFVRCSDDVILFIFEGQDDLDEDWEDNPMRTGGHEKPRANLKIIRTPKKNDCFLVQFDGPVIPVHDCHVINVGPGRWPASGDILDTPWDSLEKRYKLERMDNAKR